MVFYIGIDPSLTSTGVAVWSANGVTTQSIKPPVKMRGARRLEFLLASITELFGDVSQKGVIGAVGIEGYAFSRANQAHAKGEWGGVLRLYLHQQQRPTYEISPSGLKKFATGNGTASKSAMVLSAYKRFNADLSASDDEADALWLAYMSFAYHSRLAGNSDAVPELTLRQKASLEKVANLTNTVIRNRSR